MKPIFSIKKLNQIHSVMLWEAGKDQWNKWVAKHPDGSINFASHNFEDNKVKIEKENNIISFEGFHFPKGGVSFYCCNFIGEEIIFDNCTFHGGQLNLGRTFFDQKIISFKKATFIDCEIYADSSIFKNVKLNFRNISTGPKSINFNSIVACGSQFDFSLTHFQNGQKSFQQAILENSNLNFEDTDFRNGGYFFDQIRLLNCTTKFNKSVFGNGEFNISGALIKGGSFSFKSAQFGNGNKNFGSMKVEALNSTLDFTQIKSKSGNFIFTNIDTEAPKIDFSFCDICEGDLSFSLAKIRSKEIDFHNIRIRDGRFSFGEVEAMNSKVYFEQVTIGGVFYFAPLMEIDSLVCNQAHFQSSAIIVGAFKNIPDLRYTSLASHFDLSGIRVSDDNIKYGHITKEDSVVLMSKYLRMKEIAENNKDHHQALQYNEIELRIRRYYESNFLKKKLNLIYDKTSNYGQSILRPFLLLILMYILFLCLYNMISAQSLFLNLSASSMHASARYSAAHILPFTLIGREIMNESSQVLFQEHPDKINQSINLCMSHMESSSNKICASVHSNKMKGDINSQKKNSLSSTCLLIRDFLRIFQTTISTVLVFLIGLGLRNRFKIS